MKLLTKQIIQQLQKNPYGSHDGEGLNAPLIVKFFNPCGAGTWLITEGDELENGDWLLFGLCHITDAEWGSVLLSELQEYKGPWGLGIERDMYAKGTVRDNIKNLIPAAELEALA